MLTIALLALFSALPPSLEGARQVEYKQTKTRPLSLHLLSPAKRPARPSPAILFFFGGGWASGSVLQFAEQARAFRDLGYVAVLVDYRVRKRDGTTPFESVTDAQSAMRWMRANAAQWHVDPRRIAAAGGSAGGHLAAATAILQGLDDPPYDLGISARPDALVLFNPVVDTTESGYGAAFIGPRAEELSLTSHVQPGLPPTILFHGTADRTVPYANALAFQAAMRRQGNRCELVPFENEDHGFFNSPAFRPKNSEATYRTILQQTQKFLAGVFH
jgi:acetyl esterase/lipase